MWAIIGLGNPGQRYVRTRHNVGRSFIGQLAAEHGAKLKKRGRQVRVAETERNGEIVLLVQPMTYMNQSGLAVRNVLDVFGVKPQQIVLIYDDLDIPLGQIRVRKAGSAGSHNGVRSVIEELGTQAFPRIRVGIGPLPDRSHAVRFVLAPFKAEEWPTLEEALKKTREALNLILDGRIEQAMNRFNQKEIFPKLPESRFPSPG